MDPPRERKIETRPKRQFCRSSRHSRVRAGTTCLKSPTISLKMGASGSTLTATIFCWDPRPPCAAWRRKCDGDVEIGTYNFPGPPFAHGLPARSNGSLENACGCVRTIEALGPSDSPASAGNDLRLLQSHPLGFDPSRLDEGDRQPAGVDGNFTLDENP